MSDFILPDEFWDNEDPITEAEYAALIAERDRLQSLIQKPGSIAEDAQSVYSRLNKVIERIQAHETST